MSFSDLKKQSRLGSLTSKLVAEVEKTAVKSGGADERLWKPSLDKSGNGYAVIRFLPAPESEDIPWAKCTATRLPRSWWLVHRELSDYYWSERSGVRAQS